MHVFPHGFPVVQCLHQVTPDPPDGAEVDATTGAVVGRGVDVEIGLATGMTKVVAVRLAVAAAGGSLVFVGVAGFVVGLGATAGTVVLVGVTVRVGVSVCVRVGVCVGV